MLTQKEKGIYRIFLIICVDTEYFGEMDSIYLIVVDTKEKGIYRIFLIIIIDTKRIIKSIRYFK